MENGLWMKSRHRKLYKMWIFTYAMLSFVIKTYAQEDQTEPTYKIHMVASEEDGTKPAIFAHLESPVWDPELQSLFFVDVIKSNVYKLDYNSGRFIKKKIGFGPTHMVTRIAESNRLLVGIRASIYLLDWDLTGESSLRPLTHVDDGIPDNLVMGGKVDALGRFWFGTSGPMSRPERGSVYSIEQATGSIPRVQVRPIASSGGIEWAHNNSVLYIVNSANQKIEAYYYDLHLGSVSHRRTVFDLAESNFEHAIPQGLTIDTHGNLWVSLIHFGSIIQINPNTGQMMNEYKMPATHITNICWGGPNLDELFATSAREPENPKRPLSGAIFTLRDTGFKGAPTNSYKFDWADRY